VYRGLGCAGDPERVEIQTVLSGLDRTVPLVVWVASPKLRDTTFTSDGVLVSPLYVTVTL
jgi:hypothetical protein